MNIIDLLTKKRFGKELTQEEIRFFVKGVTTGEIAEYQASAMLMAICINGMTANETLYLTMEMAASGDMLDLSEIKGIKCDKHSTGGVGDTTSLVLVPLVAACGVKFAKMSGRGLGFTGGTLDKLESVPGLSVSMSAEKFIDTVNDVGLAIIGQTQSLAPADKVLYSLRDVTATVDCLPLVTSSILSKKIASGADVIVLDVKTGSGAVMDTYEKSVELAKTMVDIGNRTGRKFSALVTDMNQPLGNYVGNALEVYEAIEILSGRAEGDLKDVALALGAHILRLSGVRETYDECLKLMHEKLESGEGLKKLSQLFKAQGGDERVPYHPELLPKAPETMDVCLEKGGYIKSIQTDMIGYAAKALGAGRDKKEDEIDLSVGLVMKKRVGDRIEAGEAFATMHISPISNVARAKQLILDSVALSDTPVEKPVLIRGVIE
ncbi:MAG: thymidine phosphorylase [Clostridiales bacterium]|nr:thymidine phosphorylase [Clostridiales bacterium]